MSTCANCGRDADGFFFDEADLDRLGGICPDCADDRAQDERDLVALGGRPVED